MPALLERLRCGVIFTGAFIDHLRGECARERLRAASQRGGKEAPGESWVPVIHYVRCLDGGRKGEAWWSMRWEKRDRLPAGDLFGVGGIEVALPRQSRIGLKWRHVDFRDGRVVVG